MKRFFVTFAAVIAAQVLLAVIVIGTLAGFTSAFLEKLARPLSVPRHATLVQEIPATLLEFDPPQRLPFGQRPTTETLILENLEKARLDGRIENVVLRLEPCALGWGKMEEIRDAIHQLRDSGKKVYAHTFLINNRALYLASACDSIFLAPEGFVWFTGVMAERMHVKDLLETLGVALQVSRIKEYKSYPEMFTRMEMSPAVRENASRLVNDLFADIRVTIARDRRVDPLRVDQWLEIAQFDPPDAQAVGMIDGVLVWEELTRRLQAYRPNFASIDGRKYAGVSREQVGRKGPKVAVVHAQGTITVGKSSSTFPFGLMMGDETIAEALETAAKNDDIKGILLRLDTPGGMGLASERIGRAVERAAAVKPLVVSSVDMNASGGYMIAYRCSTIVAPGNAIVGSIGSFSIRPNLAGLAEKLGIRYDRVTAGPHAAFFSTFVPLDEDEFWRFDRVHHTGYERWIAGIAAYRKLTTERVDSLGRGQVYTGRQGQAVGLVDAVGGFDMALGLLKEQIGMSLDQQVSLVHYPAARSFWEDLRTADLPAAASRAGEFLGIGEPLGAQLEQAADFWSEWLRMEDDLLICEWRF